MKGNSCMGRMAMMFACALAMLPVTGRLHAQVDTSMICTGNESWVRMGDGLAGSPYGMANRDGVLYALHSRAWPVTPSDTVLGLSNWDGENWREVTTLTLHTGAPWDTVGIAYAVAANRGEIFVGGMFPGAEDLPNSKCLVRWDGLRWRSATAGLPDFYYAVTRMKEFNGELYCLVTIDGTFLQCFHWTGSAWEAATPFLRGNAPQDLMVWKGKVYVLASVNGGMGVVTWDGTAWRQVGGLLDYYAFGLELYRGRLYVADQRLLRLDGDAWTPVDSLYLPMGTGIAGVVDDGLYTCTYGHVWPDPGVRLHRFDGRRLHRVSNFDNPVRGFVKYNGTLVAYGAFTHSCGSSMNHVAMLCTDRTCGTVAGTVYADENADCRFNGEDFGMPRQIVEIRPGPYYAFTDSAGFYRKVVPPGSYAITLHPWPLWAISCPTNGRYQVALRDGGDRAGRRDFGMTARVKRPDMNVGITASRLRPGRVFTVAIRYENRGTVPTNGVVRLRIDPRLRFEGADPQATDVGGGYASWAFSDLKVAEVRYIKANLRPDPGVPVGTEICSQVRAYTSFDGGFGDPDAEDSVCVRLVASCDPNEMVVTPTNDEEMHTIAPTDSVLVYTVHFQNTGNDTAFQVVVVDTLSSLLDAATIVPGASSHPYTLRIDKNATLVWTFDDIMLPDSSENDERSRGYVTFTVRLRPGLPDFTAIPNNADIYFDFNAPVRTNTVVTVTSGFESAVDLGAGAAGMRAYPNPARDRVVVGGGLRPGTIVTLFDGLARRVAEATVGADGHADFDVSGLAAGIYMFAATAGNGPISLPVTIIR